MTQEPWLGAPRYGRSSARFVRAGYCRCPVPVLCAGEHSTGLSPAVPLPAPVQTERHSLTNMLLHAVVAYARVVPRAALHSGVDPHLRRAFCSGYVSLRVHKEVFRRPP